MDPTIKEAYVNHSGAQGRFSITQTFFSSSSDPKQRPGRVSKITYFPKIQHSFYKETVGGRHIAGTKTA